MKRAPFLCKQSPDRTLEVVILAGSLAWETSRVQRKDPDREDDVPPVVLGSDELADLDNLTIIRPDTLYVRVLRDLLPISEPSFIQMQTCKTDFAISIPTTLIVFM